ncbi:MAG: cation-transporting P-type ATPase [Gammaproteobacteria bacterium]
MSIVPHIPRDGELPIGGRGDAWHALAAEEAFKRMQTRPEGLTEAEADQRLRKYGPNSLPQPPKRGALRRLLAQFHNLLIYALLAAAVLAAVLDHLVDAAVILGVVIVNAFIGFIQEGKAEEALEAIRGMIDPHAAVRRDGRRVTVAADQICPGDVVLIEAGDRVPADLRLVRPRNLKVEEAILTGESMAVDKSVEPVAQDAALGDRSTMAYSGTFVAAGQGVGVAVATGAHTELGRISALMGEVEELKTPLIRQMDRFAKQLTAVILGVSLLAFLYARFARGYAVAEAFMTVVGLAVAAIPEGLPAVMTITLAIGVKRMAARNAIIRRLPAVETLGSVSVICSDKTGTLTRNEMTVRAVVTGTDDYEVTGVGYEPEGAFRAGGRDVDTAERPDLAEFARAALLCNDAELRQTEGSWLVDGDPMEGALVTLAAKWGLDAALLRKQLPRTDEIPFDAQHRFMASLHHSHEDGAFIVVKGAPERIVQMCTLERTAAGEQPLRAAHWHARAEELAAQGQRVLAFAARPAGFEQRDLSFADVEDGLCLLGLAGFIDPPREEAIAAVADCKAAGIRPIMITGDHAVTAREIARQLGLAKDPKALSGQDLEGMDSDALRAAVRETAVFARTTPEHKLRLVEALQGDRHIVAMTGDGVNDAPALKRADVGVAMGRKGTEAAKEAAEVVLADDNFASIVAAVREGRTVYDNLMKVIAWTLPTNGGEAFTILAAIAFGLALPVTAAQILWINMVTAVALGLTLAFEPTEPDTMRREPRETEQHILSGELLWRILFVSVLVVGGAFGVYYWAEDRGMGHETARTMVVNTIVVMEIFYLFSVRYVHGTSFTWQGVVGTRAVLIGVSVIFVAQLLFTYAPFMQAIFRTRPVALTDGVVIIAIGMTMLSIVEIEKAIRRRVAKGTRG